MAILATSLEKLKAAPLSKAVESLGGRLKKVGREYVTTCIWHEDTNPSLTINDDKGFCFCHVCREGGDVIKYVQKRKGLDFVDAANLAASILGVQLQTDGISPEEQAKRKEERLKALEALKVEQAGYKRNLFDPKAQRIRDILRGRRIEREAALEFGLGFAPKGFFGGRITIPIYNHKDELVGWTGRATKAKESQPAKYKNSAESDLFNKKTLVFNESRAKEAARLAGSLVFVEGHLDVISLWSQGFENVVAIQGTGAPEKYVLERLAKTVDNFIRCFDGDQGGKKAVEQFISAAGSMAQKGQIQINIAQVPDGMDPDELVRSKGPQALHNVISEAIPWLDWTIESWMANLDKDNTAYVIAVEKEMRKIIDSLHSNALRAHYIDKVARALTRDEKEASKVAKDWGERSVKIGEKNWELRSIERARSMAERRMLRIFVHLPQHRDQLRPLLALVKHPPLRWLCDRLEELEAHCATDLTPHSVMAVVAASEPHFLQQLRTVVQPNVIIDDTSGVLHHLSDIITETPAFESNVADTDQSP